MASLAVLEIGWHFGALLGRGGFLAGCGGLGLGGLGLGGLGLGGLGLGGAILRCRGGCGAALGEDEEEAGEQDEVGEAHDDRSKRGLWARGLLNRNGRGGQAKIGSGRHAQAPRTSWVARSAASRAPSM
ncbi:MAG: hypothetical protein EA398_14010 [Deltaproteobacteria bacterium]|nr:MAG: hypothetical protein EA398_14010 [Deltaproteobacteria bacterium]